MVAFLPQSGNDPPFLATWPMDYYFLWTWLLVSFNRHQINDVKVLFLDYHIKTSYYCNNLQPECLPESSVSSPSAADKSINDSKVRKENPLPTQLFIYCALMK